MYVCAWVCDLSFATRLTEFGFDYVEKFTHLSFKNEGYTAFQGALFGTAQTVSRSRNILHLKKLSTFYFAAALLWSFPTKESGCESAK